MLDTHIPNNLSHEDPQKQGKIRSLARIVRHKMPHSSRGRKWP